MTLERRASNEKKIVSVLFIGKAAFWLFDVFWSLVASEIREKRREHERLGSSPGHFTAPYIFPPVAIIFCYLITCGL